ncbi:hypothetical protein [Capnocytophaga sputigena]|uniref:hypothetical protein n=1 Tax=Capnocytophaga sputigena TaxID=1019 RepID=UPI003C727307
MNAEKQEMDNGLELLNKVIKSNEDNIEKLTDVVFVYQDILNLVAEFESSANSLNHRINNFETSFKDISKQIENTTKFIPKSIKTDLSENTLSRLEHFEKKSKSLKYLLIGSFRCFGIAIIVMFLSFYFSKQWYDTSIKTKEEIRSQIFKEMRAEGKEFYDIEVFNRLKMNTEIINKWIERNPKQGNNFLKFKEGYEAK